jgi:hypothetical protein
MTRMKTDLSSFPSPLSCQELEDSRLRDDYLAEGSPLIQQLSFFFCVLAPGFLLLLFASRWQARPGKNSKNLRAVWSCFWPCRVELPDAGRAMCRLWRKWRFPCGFPQAEQKIIFVLDFFCVCLYVSMSNTLMLVYIFNIKMSLLVGHSSAHL